MVMRRILCCISWSVLLFISPPVYDVLPLTVTENSSNIQRHPFSGHPRVTNAVQIKILSFPIQLSDGTSQHLTGFLFFDRHNFKICHKQRSYSRVVKCLKKRFLRNRTLQVLVHGFTYNHTYWDPPKKKLPNHSYARFMAKRGYLVLALDLLGTGKSSIPDGDILNIAESVSSLAQVLTTARLSLKSPRKEH